MKNKLPIVIKIAITVFLFYVILRKVDMQKFYQTLIGARISFLFLAFVTIWLGHFFCIARWKILLDVFRMHFSYLRLITIYAVGTFFSFFLPTAIGGDVVKFYITGRETNGSYTLSFASVFMDRNLGMFALVLIAFVSCLTHPVSINGMPLLPIITMILLGFVLANFILFHPRFHMIIASLFHNRFPKAAKRLDIISKAFTTIRKDKPALIKALILSLMNHLTAIFMSWLIAMALGGQISFVYFLILVPIINLIVMIPITPMGLGVREFAFKSLFSAIGADPEKSVAIGLIMSSVTILSALPGGIFYIFFKKQGAMRNLEEAKAL